MMKKLAVPFLACLLAASAQAPRTNFSGTWELAVSKSDFGKSGAPKKVTLVVSHRGSNIHVMTTMVVPQGQFQSDANYTTTGVEDTNSDQGATTKTRCHWENEQLVIEGNVLVQKRTIRLRERWSLADRGKTFINERVLHLPSGVMPQKLVYTQVGPGAKK